MLEKEVEQLLSKEAITSENQEEDQYISHYVRVYSTLYLASKKEGIREQ